MIYVFSTKIVNEENNTYVILARLYKEVVKVVTAN